MTHRRFICGFFRYPWAPYNDVKNTGFIDTWVSSWEKVHRLLNVLVTKNKTKQKKKQQWLEHSMVKKFGVLMLKFLIAWQGTMFILNWKASTGPLESRLGEYTDLDGR